MVRLFVAPDFAASRASAWRPDSLSWSFYPPAPDGKFSIRSGSGHRPVTGSGSIVGRTVRRSPPGREPTGEHYEGPPRHTVPLFGDHTASEETVVVAVDAGRRSGDIRPSELAFPSELGEAADRGDAHALLPGHLVNGHPPNASPPPGDR